MLAKSLLVVLLLAVSLQPNAAEEKFETFQEILRHGVQEFTKATYGSIAKGVPIAEKLVEDLNALEPKTDADKYALEKLEKFLEKVEEFNVSSKPDESLENKLMIILNGIIMVGKYKSAESESLQNSEAAKELLQKHGFSIVRESFFNDFKIFADHFTEEVEDFLTYAAKEKRGFLDEWITEFKNEKDVVKKLHLFLEMFVIFEK